jgi:hypothetical protein
MGKSNVCCSDGENSREDFVIGLEVSQLHFSDRLRRGHVNSCDVL